MEKKINYRAQFRLEPVASKTDHWVHLLKLLANWINLRNPNEATKSTIYGGLRKGHLSFRGDGIEVVVRSEKQSELADPKYFAVRFSHQETDGEMAGWRTWINEFGVELTEEGHYLLAMTNSYQIKNAFIGELTDPSITSPNIVKKFVSDTNWETYLASTKLSVEPIQVSHENVKEFRDFLFDPERKVPIVYVSVDSQGKYLIDPEMLALKIVGNGLVYKESDKSVGQYLKASPHFEPYRCTSGAVRIYLPQADFRKKSDPSRHRFFTPVQVAQSPGLIAKVVAESIVRRSVFIKPFGLQGINDLERLRIESQLAEALKNKESEAIIESLKAQVENLKDSISKAQAESIQYCAWYDEKEEEVGRLEDELEKSESKCFELKSRNDILETQINASQDGPEAPETIAENLYDLLTLIEKHYPNKVVVLSEAKESARGFAVKDINKAWKLLKSIPEKLHPIMFFKDGDKRAQFQDESGFDLSMTESKMTKADKKLAKQRKIQYQGNDVEMNSHVGYGTRKPNLLRIHFHISAESKKIVIGHCGEHLPTFSTRSIH